MISLSIRKLCEFNGCKKRPTYNFDGKNAIYCVQHKVNGMVDVISRRCITDGCTKRATFNFINKKPEFCADHKIQDMVDVAHKSCEFDNCRKQPSYDFKGFAGKFCALHKQPNMIDIKNRYCEYIGCEIVNPIFNIKGSTHGRYCIHHKEDNMVDIKHKRCIIDGCDTRPTYNIKGKAPRFCVIHKLQDMVDVTHKVCEYKECNIRATYGNNNEIARYCSNHKEHGMVDISNKRCIIPNCTTRPTYGKPGLKVSHCARHRLIGMIRNPRQKCIMCTNISKWGKNMTLLHCDDHKEADDINYVESVCKSCNLQYILDENMLCEMCNPKSFKTNSLSKQNQLMAYLDQIGLNGISTDKMIDNGNCGKERPDRVFDGGDKIVILECDENQHRDRLCDCEQIRMANIGQMYGGIPVYFIRFNPDTYKPKNIDTKLDTIRARYATCSSLILSILNNTVKLPINSLVSVLYLYYDGWSTLSEENWEIITSIT